MRKIHIPSLPIAANVCGQVLREVTQFRDWSVAHVVMNPQAESLLHFHQKMGEIYVITRGMGELVKGIFPRLVAAGSAHVILDNVPHMLTNKSMGQLEHLVFASPPFDPEDVHVLSEQMTIGKATPLDLPPVEECFDGARIISYAFPRQELSIAFGSVQAGSLEKKPHYHNKATEFIYVVEGRGQIELDGERMPVGPGDWTKIEPGVAHAIINESPEELVVVCTCSPAFEMSDVYYR